MTQWDCCRDCQYNHGAYCTKGEPCSKVVKELTEKYNRCQEFLKVERDFRHKYSGNIEALQRQLADREAVIQDWAERYQALEETLKDKEAELKKKGTLDKNFKEEFERVEGCTCKDCSSEKSKEK